MLACSSLGAHTVEVPLDKLQDSIAKQFPFSSSFAQLIDLTITTPKLRTLPDANRIATDVDLSLAPRFMSRKFAGSLSMDSELRFEPSDGTVRLVKPRVQKFDLPGFKLSDTAQGDLNLSKLAEFIVENGLNDMVVHQVKPDDLKRLGTQWSPQEIKVTPSGLSVTLQPQPQK